MRSVRPIDPAKSTSPTTASGRVGAGDDEAHTAGRVARRVPHLELDRSNRHGVTVSQHQIRFRWRLDLETKHLCLQRRIAIELDFVGVEADRQLASEQTRQVGGATDMVEVTVGVEDHRRAETGGAHTVGDLLRLLAGIDDHQLSGIGVSQQDTVRLDWTDWEHFKENGLPSVHFFRPDFETVTLLCGSQSQSKAGRKK